MSESPQESNPIVVAGDKDFPLESYGVMAELERHRISMEVGTLGSFFGNKAPMYLAAIIALCLIVFLAIFAIFTKDQDLSKTIITGMIGAMGSFGGFFFGKS